jgi:hypothetical protein
MHKAIYLEFTRLTTKHPDEVNEFFFSFYLIPPTAINLGVYSASNRNEYQKQKSNISGVQRTAGA